MTGRRLTIASSHPDGRLRLGDLRRLVAGADNPTVLPDASVVPPIDDDALVLVSPRWGRGRSAITVAEEGAQ